MSPTTVSLTFRRMAASTLIRGEGAVDDAEVRRTAGDHGTTLSPRMPDPVMPRLRDASSEMVHLDALPWTAGWAFTSFDVRIGVRANHASILPRLAAQLPPGWQPASSPLVDQLYSIVVPNGRDAAHDHLHRLYLGPHEILSVGDLDVLIDRFSSDVHHQVAAHATSRLFVHAGVVGWRDRAIVMPGRSHSGKSSLVAALVRAGALYYSDEYAVFDRQGRVHPYAKRLSLRQVAGGRQFCSAEALGGRVGTDPLPVGLLAVLRYEPGATWEPRPLLPGQAVLALLDNTVLARSQPEFALSALGQAAAGATAFSSARGEAQDIGPQLLELLTHE